MRGRDQAWHRPFGVGSKRQHSHIVWVSEWPTCVNTILMSAWAHRRSQPERRAVADRAFPVRLSTSKASAANERKSVTTVHFGTRKGALRQHVSLSQHSLASPKAFLGGVLHVRQLQSHVKTLGAPNTAVAHSKNQRSKTSRVDEFGTSLCPGEFHPLNMRTRALSTDTPPGFPTLLRELGAHPCLAELSGAANFLPWPVPCSQGVLFCTVEATRLEDKAMRNLGPQHGSEMTIST